MVAGEGENGWISVARKQRDVDLPGSQKLEIVPGDFVEIATARAAASSIPAQLILSGLLEAGVPIFGPL